MDNPQLKAKELFDKYYVKIQESDKYSYLLRSEEKDLSKQCSIICVDEIINFGSKHGTWSIGEPYNTISDEQYWNNVKQAINEL